MGVRTTSAGIRDFPRFATQILGWERPTCSAAPTAILSPETLEVALPEYNETLRPSYAVPEFSSNQQPATGRTSAMAHADPAGQARPRPR